MSNFKPRRCTLYGCNDDACMCTVQPIRVFDRTLLHGASSIRLGDVLRSLIHKKVFPLHQLKLIIVQLLNLPGLRYDFRPSCCQLICCGLNLWRPLSGRTIKSSTKFVPLNWAMCPLRHHDQAARHETPPIRRCARDHNSALAQSG